MSKELPASPNLLHLKHQAKKLQKEFQQGNKTVLRRVFEHHPYLKYVNDQLKHSDAYHVLAREYGFESWSKLKKYVEERQSSLISTEELKRNKELQTTELSKLAHEVFEQYQSQSSDVYARIRKHFKRFENANDDDIQNGIFTMVDAHQLIALEHGFDDWSAFLDSFEDEVDDVFEEAVDAIVEGDIETLKRLLQQHPELIHAASSRKHKATLLHYCSANGIEDYRQKTPPNAVEIMETLLEAGAKPDAFAKTYYGNESGQTTLNLLVTSGHPQEAGLQGELTKVLVQAGAKVNGIEDDCFPLSAAIAHNCTPAVDALVDFGARVDHIVIAPGCGITNYVQRCLDDQDQLKQEANRTKVGCIQIPNDPQKIPGQALFFAAKHGRTETLKLLLDRNINPDALQHENQVAIHWASYNGHFDCVKLLIEAGANAAIRDKRWFSSAFGWAATSSQTRIIEYLKQHAEFDIIDSVDIGDVEAVKRCIAQDPECVHAPDGKGAPLRIAAYHGHEEIVRLLLKHGANPTLENPEGQSTIQIAKERGHKNIVNLLNNQIE